MPHLPPFCKMKMLAAPAHAEQYNLRFPPPEYSPPTGTPLSVGKFSLTYCTGIGKGEPIRWMFAYTNTPFEDKRIEGKDWASIKATLPIQRIPVFERTSNDGMEMQTLGQCDAIIRHVARVLGIGPKSALDTALAEEAFVCLKDFETALQQILSEKDPATKQQLVNQFKADIEPRLLKYLDKKLHENGGKSLGGGSEPIYVDVFLACLFDLARHDKSIGIHQSSGPGLVALAKSISESPGVKAYLATRPEKISKNC